MTESEMIEAMATAMCRIGGNDPDASFATEDSPLWLDWLPEARAALNAIRPHLGAIQARAEAAEAKNAALQEALVSAYSILSFAFRRIHSLPRSRDTELAADIGKIRAQIENVLGESQAALGDQP